MGIWLRSVCVYFSDPLWGALTLLEGLSSLNPTLLLPLVHHTTTLPFWSHRDQQAPCRTVILFTRTFYRCSAFPPPHIFFYIKWQCPWCARTKICLMIMVLELFDNNVAILIIAGKYRFHKVVMWSIEVIWDILFERKCILRLFCGEEDVARLRTKEAYGGR